MSTGEEGAGEMHAPRETQGTCATREAQKVFDASFAARLLQVSRDACISLAP